MSVHETARSGEFLDVVNQIGQPTGRIEDKAVIHAEGLLHRDVHVWITDGNNLLQQQRRWDKSIMPGMWDISVGGHVGSGESYLEAAIRETREELGLDLAAARFTRIGLVASELVFPGWKQPHRVVGDNFAVYEPGLRLDTLQLQESEVLDAAWYPIDRLEEDLLGERLRDWHAPQPMALYALGIAGMRGVAAAGRAEV